MQGPKQLPPAEEWLIAEEAAQRCVLGHHVGTGRLSALLGRIKACCFWTLSPGFPALYTAAVLTHPSLSLCYF